jgi:hypothetical protein
MEAKPSKGKVGDRQPRGDSLPSRLSRLEGQLNQALKGLGEIVTFFEEKKAGLTEILTAWRPTLERVNRLEELTKQRGAMNLKNIDIANVKVGDTLSPEVISKLEMADGELGKHRSYWRPTGPKALWGALGLVIGGTAAALATRYAGWFRPVAEDAPALRAVK